MSPPYAVDGTPLSNPNLLKLTSVSAPTSPMVGYPSLSLAVDTHSTAPSSPASSATSSAASQPTARIRRPKNPFILFRCDFVKRGVVPASVERDHRNISRIAGRAWRLMTPAEKRPWEVLAAIEKDEHAKAYPGYKYKPSSRGTAARSAGEGKRQARRSRAEDSRCDQIARIVVQMRDGETLQDLVPSCEPHEPNISRRRSSSCPPVPSASEMPSSSRALQTLDPSFFTHREDLFGPDWNLGLHSDLPQLQDWAVPPDQTFYPGQLYPPFQCLYDDNHYLRTSHTAELVPLSLPQAQAMDMMPQPLFGPDLQEMDPLPLSSHAPSAWEDQAVVSRFSNDETQFTPPVGLSAFNLPASYYPSPIVVPRPAGCPSSPSPFLHPACAPSASEHSRTNSQTASPGSIQGEAALVSDTAADIGRLHDGWGGDSGFTYPFENNDS